MLKASLCYSENTRSGLGPQGAAVRAPWGRDGRACLGFRGADARALQGPGRKDRGVSVRHPGLVGRVVARVAPKLRRQNPTPLKPNKPRAGSANAGSCQVWRRDTDRECGSVDARGRQGRRV